MQITDKLKFECLRYRRIYYFQIIRQLVIWQNMFHTSKHVANICSKTEIYIYQISSKSVIWQFSMFSC